MILKRLAENLRKQNWFNVFIELLLIVVGVLIALEVDNWNEYRQDKDLEQQYIQRLIKDLEADVIEFNRVIKAAEERLSSGLRLRTMLETQEVSDKDYTDLVFLIRHSGFTARSQITAYTVEALKSNGQLRLINSVEIQNQLLAYYAYIESRRQYDYINERSHLKYLDVSDVVLSMEQRDRYFARVDETVTIEEGKIIWQNIKVNPKFRQALPNVIINQRNFQWQCKNALRRAKELLAVLRTQISK